MTSTTARVLTKPAKSRPSLSSIHRQETRLAILLVTPALVGIIGLAILPILRTIWISLHTLKLNEPGLGQPFVGLQNYVDLVTDQEHRLTGALVNTINFTVFSVALELVLGVAIALLIHRAFIGRGVVRASVLVPWAIPTSVSALMWKFIFDDRLGLFNALLAKFGIVGSQTWLGDPHTAMGAMIATDVWKTTPFMALLLLAGLQVIPEELYEAARVDGAGPWTSFWRITLPLLKPALLVALVFRTLDAFRVFDLIFVMTGGGPGNSTETLTLYGYKTLMRYLDFGHGSAITVIVFLCVLAITYFYTKVLGANLSREV